MKRNFWVVLVSLALFAVGCSRVGSRPDTEIASDVQSRINGDNNVPDKQLTINANNGVVTLSGNVSSDAARNAAGSDAGQIAGVKTVVNNLQVTPNTAATQMQQPQEQASNNPPLPAREERRPSPRRHERASSSTGSNNGDNGLRT
ncbi:MAG TPA: BON domain-containing protein, partial [Candidatus Sulfotelmatobacter sp.]|nr:BON domain-containing protein [Candidatus Sulfotelmatobacter sp.]